MDCGEGRGIPSETILGTGRGFFLTTPVPPNEGVGSRPPIAFSLFFLISFFYAQQGAYHSWYTPCLTLCGLCGLAVSPEEGGDEIAVELANGLQGDLLGAH